MKHSTLIIVSLFVLLILWSNCDSSNSSDQTTKEGFHNWWSMCAPFDWKCRSYYRTYRWRAPYYNYRPSMFV